MELNPGRESLRAKVAGAQWGISVAGRTAGGGMGQPEETRARVGLATIYQTKPFSVPGPAPLLAKPSPDAETAFIREKATRRSPREQGSSEGGWLGGWGR